MGTWLFEKIKRVPPITDEQIAEMRHIEPLFRVPDTCWFRRIEGADKVDPRRTACNWDSVPVGEEFTFDTLNVTTIVTQHSCSFFFKPSLDEVYAWIRFYLGKEWRSVRFFCLGEAKRIGGSTDYYCECALMAGPAMVRGGYVGNGSYHLVAKEEP